MNVRRVVELEFTKMLGERHELASGLWLLGEIQRQSNFYLSMWVAKCPGGAYSAFGNLIIDDDNVALHLKTVWGIIRHQSRQTTHIFEFCNPDFPDNIFGLIEAAAVNADRAFGLAHTRSWAKYHRNMAKGSC